MLIRALTIFILITNNPLTAGCSQKSDTKACSIAPLSLPTLLNSNNTLSKQSSQKSFTVSETHTKKVSFIK